LQSQKQRRAWEQSTQRREAMGEVSLVWPLGTTLLIISFSSRRASHPEGGGLVVALQEAKKEEVEKPKEAAAEEKKDDKPKDAAAEDKPKEGGGEEKPKDGEEKKEDAPPPPPPPPEEVEMRVYMHCEGCARKVKKILKRFDGKMLPWPASATCYLLLCSVFSVLDFSVASILWSSVFLFIKHT